MTHVTLRRLPVWAIALQLSVTGTARFHGGSVPGKLGSANRAEVLVIAARRSLLPTRAP